MKIKLLVIALLPLLLLGCDMNDLFDEGDTRKTYDGPDQVAFFPLQQEVNLSSGAATVEIQLISSEANASNRSVGFSTAGTAQAGVHYNLVTSSPATISSGALTVDVQIELIEGSLEAGQSVLLEMTLTDGGGAQVAPNLSTARIFIAG
ncbi:MAG: hypothetical protein JJU37_07825 [Balneolaceae bacterium]|nr:hypothetical protein [Balneolaceae bacterium]